MPSCPGGPENDSFQDFLLEFSAAATRVVSSAEILKLFCREARNYFQVSGTYVWQLVPPDLLSGVEADGWMAANFRGSHLRSHESAIANEAVLKRECLYINGLDTSRYPMAAEFRVRSIMAVPLILSNEVLGAAVFVHTADTDFFRPNQAAQASILATQLGGLLESARLSERAREEQRRAGILAEVAQSLHSEPDLRVLADAVADRLRALLRTPLVCVLARGEERFELWAVATEDPAAAESVRSRFDGKDLEFAFDLASRAIAAGEPISVTINPAGRSLGELVPPGALLAAPFRTSTRDGAVLVYPRREGPFTTDEKSLLPIITSFAAVAISNAELYSTARAQAHELHQTLSIASELGSIADIDQFMQRFLQRASQFLGYGRAFVGVMENDALRIRWSLKEDNRDPAGFLIPEGNLTRAMREKQVFRTEDASQLPNANTDLLAKYGVRQLLAVPLLGINGGLSGLFGLVDQNDGQPISDEDVRRAQGLATQVTVALEVSRNLALSEQHRRKAEALTTLALEINSLLRGREFARNFVARFAEIMAAPVAGLILEGGAPSCVLAPDPGSQLSESMQGGFSRAALAAISSTSDAFSLVPAERLAGADAAAEAHWGQVLVAGLRGTSGELLGALCLVDPSLPLSEADQQLLEAICGQASVALENARFFVRMEQANRHWIEIFDAIPDFIVAHDPSGNVLRVNRSLADFIGVQPQQLIGINMGALLELGGTTSSHSCPFCRAGGTVTDEYLHPVLERTYLVSTSEVHAASSEGLQTIHVLKDITDRREAERRYRELFDNIQEGLFFCSPDGRFVEVNDALVRMLGHDNRDGLLHSDPRLTVFPIPERHREMFAALERDGMLRNREEVLRQKNGTPVHVLINAFAVKDAQGNVLQYRGLMLDVSGLRAYQSELQRERDFSGKILNNTQSLILVVDTAGLISYANRRWKVLGYEQQEILGRQLETVVAPLKREAFKDAYSAVLAGRQVDNLELQVLHADGRVGQFSVNLSPMRDEQAQITSIVVVMSDVTDAASLQSKLMHAEKMAAVGQLVSGVAHEVNNPLTAILGFADLLMENSELPDSARKDLRVILQEAQRTKQIVQNLLSFARQMPPQRKPVQLGTILKRTIQLRAYDFHSRGVAITESYPEDLPFVIGDSQQLQQVFLNILNNAYDAVREAAGGPRIEISTSRQGNLVEVCFRDNGHGVQHADRIFDPFFTTKQVGEGTGLGLSICYGIVKEHGGEIFCSNNVDGLGATFTVRLPALNEIPSLSASAAAGVIKP